VLSLPGLSPAVGQVDDEDQLDDDEEQGPHQPKVHPGVTEAAVGDEEGAHPAADHQQVLQGPESVLQAGPGVTGCFDTNHAQGHQQKEEGHHEADPVDSKVSDSILTLDLDIGYPGF